MNPVQNVVSGIPDINIGAPPGKEAEIMPLPAAIGVHYSGMPLIVSRWKPTPEELAALNAGGDLYLCVFSGRMVPVMLTTDQPIGVQQYQGAAYEIMTPDHPDYKLWSAPPGIGG